VAVCVIPGCDALVEAFGEVCDACVEAFGALLRRGGPPVTEGQITARDEQTRAAYRARHAAETTNNSARHEAARRAGHLEMKAATITSTNTAAAAAESVQRKRNQKCWLCEERRTCTRQPQGWECDQCRQVA
jgi:hypothetical protein